MLQVAIYGKGGIGKSTVSANISYQLASEGKTVAQIGCDPKHDSTRLLLNGRTQRTILDHINTGDDSEVLSIGKNGIYCLEAGGPEPGVGCAGRGILTAFDFIEKPSSSDNLLSIIARAVEKRRLVLENQQLLANLQQENGPVLIGRSPQMQQLRKMILNVADTGADVLIYGETGCGKEVVARMLHHWSTRRQGQFVALNCAGLPETLFESEIFGHEAGAFTGAVKKRIGKIEHANGGTLFLDEIEGMPSGMQVKLLRVLQERTIERLGANQLIPVNCRVIAATKEDLLRRSEEHLFRLDLYYRLNVVSLNIPPLRQRREDIPELFYWFASQAAQKYNRPLPDISPMLLAWLQSQSWPGNVRELKHNAERFVLGLLTHHQPVPMTQQEESGLTACIDAFEKKLIEDMLRQTEGQVSLTARLLQLPRKTLYDKLNKHQIQPQVYRPESSS